MTIVTFLVGIPCSGKSTFLKNNDLYRNHVILSTDDELEKIAAEKAITYNIAFENHFKEAEKRMQEVLKEGLAEKRNFVIDQTNLTKKSRKKKMGWFPKEYSFEVVVFETSMMDILSRLKIRNSSGNKVITTKIIDTMLFSYESPTEEEGFSKIIKYPDATTRSIEMRKNK